MLHTSVAMFENKDNIDWVVTNTTNGVEIEMDGTTICGKSLAWVHAQVISEFTRLGRAEVREPHAVLEVWQC